MPIDIFRSAMMFLLFYFIDKLASQKNSKFRLQWKIDLDDEFISGLCQGFDISVMLFNDGFGD